MTADIMEPDTIIIEVVEDSHAELVTLTVVGLGNSTAAKR